MLTNKEFIRLICERGGVVCIQNHMIIKNVCQIAPNGKDDTKEDIKDREEKIKYVIDDMCINNKLKSLIRLINVIPSTKNKKVPDEGIFKMFSTNDNNIIWVYICSKDGSENDDSYLNGYISAVNVSIMKHMFDSENMWTDRSSGLIKCKEFKGEIDFKGELDIDKQRLTNSSGDTNPEVFKKRIMLIGEKLSKLDLDKQNKIFNIIDSLMEL